MKKILLDATIVPNPIIEDKKSQSTSLSLLLSINCQILITKKL